MAEFALVAPWFFMLLFGIIEVGRFVFYYEVLHNATREGARYAIVNGANSLTCSSGPAAPGTTSCDPEGNEVAAAVQRSAFNVLGNITVDRCWWDADSACNFANNGEGNNSRGSNVTVAAAYSYKTLVPLLPLPVITVTAESSLVINN